MSPIAAITPNAPEPCSACGHDPACGFAWVVDVDRERWYCHTESHSCYGNGGRPVTATPKENPHE